MVLADVGRGDAVLRQITSKPYGDSAAVTLRESDFGSGSLSLTSYARPGKLFTASSELMTAEIGSLKAEALTQIVNAVVSVLRSGTISPTDPRG